MFELLWFVPRNSNTVSVLLILASCIYAATTGYDAAIMTGFNIIPAYSEFFHLNTVTKSLLTACYFMGAIFSALAFGPVCNIIGRKNTIIISVFVKFLGISLMASAHNFGMFIAGRIILGSGSGISGTATATWVAETISHKWRGSALSFIFAVYYVGSLTASGVTYGTSSISGNLGWRIPAALQVIWSAMTLAILAFIPESPRWLAYRGRLEEARQVVALAHSNGDVNGQEAIIAYKEIIDTLQWEKEAGEKLSFAEVFRTKGSRYRIMLVLSVSVFQTLTGSSVISYFLGTILTNAGVTNSHTQLEINIILSAWCLVCAVIGTQLVDRLGRRVMGLISLGGCTLFLFLVGAFTKLYGSSTNQSGIYATVAMIFLFQGSYAWGMTNLTLLYPPEVLNYSIRSHGMALFTAVNFSLTIFTIFALPIALKHIGYKMYMINAVWDILQCIFIYFLWIETKGKTLEEISELFDGEKHSDVPDISHVKLEILDEKTIVE